MSLSIACIERTGPTSKRQDILSTAWIHFSANGFAGSSINAITREAGVSKESMYRYFSGKEHLFEAVLDQELAHHESEMARAVAAAERTRDAERFYALARAILGVLCARRAIALRKLLAQRHPCLANGAKHRRLFAAMRRANAAVEALLARHPTAPPEPARLADYFMSMLVYRNVLERDCSVLRSPSEADIARRAQAAVDDFSSAFLQTAASRDA